MLTAADTYVLQNSDATPLERVAEIQKTIGGIVFHVAEDNLPALNKRLTSLNKKAVKLGCEPITLALTDETSLESYCTDAYSGRPQTFLHRYVILSGSTPQVEGHTMIAALAHTEAGTLVHRVPVAFLGECGPDGYPEAVYSEINLKDYADAGPHCDHCNKIRSRNNTYIMWEEETGTLKQIGRTCLRDYTGSNNPEAIAKLLEYVWDWSRCASEPGTKPIISTRNFLAHAACLVRVQNGYQKGMKGDIIHNYFSLANRRTINGRPDYIEPIAVDYEKADATLVWGRALAPQTSEFLENVRKALSVDTVADKTEGVLGYATTAHDNQHFKEIQEAGVRQAADSADHIAQVGARFTRTFTVDRIISCRSNYSADGTAPLYILHDEFGSPAKWFASSWQSIEVGNSYEITATVKAHESHDKYGRSTLLTRCKVLREVPA